MPRNVPTILVATLLAGAPAAAQQAYFAQPPAGGRTVLDSAGTQRHYDERGRLSGSSQRSANGTTTNHYDARGRLAGSSERSPNGTTTNRYDERGRRAGSSEQSSNGTTTWHYDASGRIAGSSVRLSNGQVVQYDAAGRMITR